MISLPSSELIAAENAILQVTVKIEFLRLRLITGYTVCVRIMLPLFYKCTPTQKSFVLKYSFVGFIFVCLKNVSDVQLLKRPGILRWCVLAFETVKQGSLRSVKVLGVTKMILQKWSFEFVSPLRNISSPAET